jgi:hypothetical protein
VNLFYERPSPRGIAVDAPIARLPLARACVHASDFPALGIDRDDTRDIALQALNDCRSVGLVFDQHRTDRAIHVSLSSTDPQGE